MKTEDGPSTMGVLVKFVTKYNEGAYPLLAKEVPPLAPTLHSCTRVIGGMFSTVVRYQAPPMERSAGTFPRLS